MQTIVNDAMINRLLDGDDESVRRLKSIGLSLTWCIDRVINEHGEPVSLEAEGSIPAGHRVERFSMWHWSHRAHQPEGVAEWWNSLERQLAQTEPQGQARILEERFIDALTASALSGETQPALYTWTRAMDQGVPQWERKVMVDRLLNVLEEQGNRLSPLLRRLHMEEHLTAKDWTDQSRKRYVTDPIDFLYRKRAWEALRVLLDADAAPVFRHGEPLLDETVHQVHASLIQGQSPDAEAIRLLGYMLLRQAATPLDPEVRLKMQKIEKFLEGTEHQAEFIGHARAQKAHERSNQTQPVLVNRPRRRS